MATPVTIDLTNYATHLKQSTQGRAGTPDGNIFFDVATGEIEIITAEELATVDLPGGGGAEANPLTNQLGIKMEALYAFENQERVVDENLRKYNRFTDASFKFAGAFEFVFGRKPADNDRNKIRGSGWIERAIGDAVNRIYFGTRSLGANIQSGSQPFYQLAAGGAPTNFAKAGKVNEAVQVYGDASNGNFDSRSYFAMSIRTFGQTYDRKTLADSDLSQSDGYATGFAIDELPHLTSGSYDLADVYGGAQIAPWTGMTLEKLAVAQTETGFNEADGDFTWVLHNTANGTLNECVAFLDALAQTDNDIDSGAVTVTNGKRVNTWYYYDAEGKVITRSGADSLGLFIENIPAADQQRIKFTDDAAALKTRPFKVQVEMDPQAIAISDPNAWYHLFYTDGAAGADYNTSGAVTVKDDNDVDVKGNVSANVVGGKLVFDYDYDGDDDAGLTPGTDKEMTLIVEGDGIATQQKVTFTVTRDAVVRVTCAPGLETNV